MAYGVERRIDGLYRVSAHANGRDYFSVLMDHDDLMCLGQQINAALQHAESAPSATSDIGMSQLLCDIWTEMQSSRSLRLSLPIHLVERIHAVVAQQQHI